MLYFPLLCWPVNVPQMLAGGLGVFPGPVATRVSPAEQSPLEPAAFEGCCRTTLRKSSLSKIYQSDREDLLEYFVVKKV